MPRWSSDSSTSIARWPWRSSSDQLVDRPVGPALLPCRRVDLGGQAVERERARSARRRWAATRAARSTITGRRLDRPVGASSISPVDDDESVADAAPRGRPGGGRRAPRTLGDPPTVRAAAAMSAISASAAAPTAAAATASWSSRRSTSPGRPVTRCRATDRDERVLALVEQGEVVGRDERRPASAAHHSVWTSRSPPWPSLRSGSRRNATSPAWSRRSITRERRASSQRRPLRCQRASPSVARPAGQLVVAGDERAAEQRRRRVEVVIGQRQLLVDERTAWPSLSPASHSGYHSAAATSSMPPPAVVHQQDVDVALRGELAAPVATDGDEGPPNPCGGP